MLLDFSEDIPESIQVENNSKLWVNKYRPKCVADICLDTGLKNVFESQAKSGDIQNVTLLGPPGTGKTTMALALVNEIHGEPLFVSCAAGEGKVDTIGMKIIPFCQYSSPNRKVIILDELDSASANQASSFQKALRNVIEAYPDCRFIATANYAENIIEPILSRLPPVSISFNIQEMMKRVLYILKEEKVDLSVIDPSELKTLLGAFIRTTYPDVRSLLGKLQMACTDGLTADKLKALAASDDTDGLYDNFYAKVIQIIKNSASPFQMRSMVNNAIVNAIADDENGLGLLTNSYYFAKGLFMYALAKDLVKDMDALIQMTEQLRTIEVCIDKEPQVFRMLLLMSRAFSS